MSDTKNPDKAKRQYRADGHALGYDLRVRISAQLHSDLKRYAAEHDTTPAAAARAILTAALNPEE